MEEILHQAEQLEKNYDWLGAAESYGKALRLLPGDDFSSKAEIDECLGYAYYRAAFQAESNDEFKEKLRRAVSNYEKAKENFKLNGPEKTGRALRCDAMNKYICYWLAIGATEKKRLLGECWRLTQEALKVSEEFGKAEEYVETFNQLSTSALLAFCYEGDYQLGKKIVKEMAGHGEVGIKLFSTVGKPDELAKTHAKTAFALSLFAFFFLDLDEKESCVRKAQGYWTRAKEASEDLARLEMLCPVPCAQDALWGAGSEEVLEDLQKAVEYGRKTRDRFIIGSAMDWLTYHATWALARIDDSDELTKRTREVIQQAEDAMRQYSVISFTSPRADLAWIEAIHGNVQLGYWGETDLGKRHDILERAVAAERKALEPAEASGYPYAKMYVHWWLSLNLLLSANSAAAAAALRFAGIVSSPQERESLLEEALQHGNEALRFGEQLLPLSYWDIGLFRQNLALIKCGLADLAKETETKKRMLYSAMVEMENAIKLLVRYVSFQPEKKTAFIAGLGGWQYWAGDWWIRLYRLTRDKHYLREAAKIFADALESNQKANLPSRMAECYWKIARAYDELNDHITAAKNFRFASDNFKSAEEKIPQLKCFYEDHALYMEAWADIEMARYHHERQEYNAAMECFQRAAKIHESLGRWTYFAPNYFAWAQLENAEELSRREAADDSVKAFEKAAKLFAESKNAIQTQLSTLEGAEEKIATDMIKSTDIRYEYCRARMVLEDARLLDKKGDHLSSSEKYGLAAENFEAIGHILESEQEQKELRLITVLAYAWREMAEAEAEESPQHYLEACQLFEKAKDLGKSEKMKALLLGHSRFCRALEAGAKFADTGDMNEHAKAMQYLESTTNLYLKADFQSASDYAKATRLLIDAHFHLNSAAKETDSEKKTQLYIVAQKVLRASADAYAKAGNLSRKEYVLKLLERTNEQRELAFSLTEVLHAPVITSTRTFAVPSPTSEEAVGLEKFQHAEINANLILGQRELKVGEDIELDIEIANAGKDQALLNIIEGAIPEGFDIKQKPEAYRVEGLNINMKGKRLDPLKTEELKLTLRPKHKGSFVLAPRILYLDENGNSKYHQPEPLKITVEELGIKGWLKGER